MFARFSKKRRLAWLKSQLASDTFLDRAERRHMMAEIHSIETALGLTHIETERGLAPAFELTDTPGVIVDATQDPEDSGDEDDEPDYDFGAAGHHFKGIVDDDGDEEDIACEYCGLYIMHYSTGENAIVLQPCPRPGQPAVPA